MAVGRITTEADLAAFIGERLSPLSAQTRQLRATVIEGTGSPEGVVTAPVGTLYVNRAGGAGSTLYVKETGAEATGWTAK